MHWQLVHVRRGPTLSEGCQKCQFRHPFSTTVPLDVDKHLPPVDLALKFLLHSSIKNTLDSPSLRLPIKQHKMDVHNQEYREKRLYGRGTVSQDLKRADLKRVSHLETIN